MLRLNIEEVPFGARAEALNSQNAPLWKVRAASKGFKFREFLKAEFSNTKTETARAISKLGRQFYEDLITAIDADEEEKVERMLTLSEWKGEVERMLTLLERSGEKVVRIYDWQLPTSVVRRWKEGLIAAARAAVARYSTPNEEEEEPEEEPEQEENEMNVPSTLPATVERMAHIFYSPSIISGCMITAAAQTVARYKTDWHPNNRNGQYSTRLKPNQIGCHLNNRNGQGPQASCCQQLTADLSGKGFPEQANHLAVAIQCDPKDKERFSKHTTKVARYSTYRLQVVFHSSRWRLHVALPPPEYTHLSDEDIDYSLMPRLVSSSESSNDNYSSMPHLVSSSESSTGGKEPLENMPAGMVMGQW